MTSTPPETIPGAVRTLARACGSITCGGLALVLPRGPIGERLFRMSLRLGHPDALNDFMARQTPEARREVHRIMGR